GVGGSRETEFCSGRVADFWEGVGSYGVLGNGSKRQQRNSGDVETSGRRGSAAETERGKDVGRRSRAAQGKDRRSLRVFRRQQPSRCSGWKSGNGSFTPQGGMSAKPGSDPAEGRRAW